MKKIYIIMAFLLVIVISFLYLEYQSKFSRGLQSEVVTIEIQKGDDAAKIGKILQKEKVIKSRFVFYFYLWRTNQLHSIMAGKYTISENLSISEIVKIITQANKGVSQVKITFPEGWTVKQMSERLTVNGFDGKAFVEIAKKPSKELLNEYGFLNNQEITTLEGFLFPDTYLFAKDASAETIIRTMLNNFDVKVYARDFFKEKSLYTLLIMASVVEGEVPTDADRKIVSGIFWKRMEIGMPLQSDATLEYVLGTNAVQHSIEETQLDSPYNTYKVKGLPPTPVNNPGLASIEAAANPQKTDYLFFLSDVSTGETIFSKTFEEHVANKSKYSL